jgi:hypothetical protein
MMDAIQVWPQMMQVAGDLVAKAQDWPGAEDLANRLKKTIPPQYLDEDDLKDGGGPGIDPQQFQQVQQALQEALQKIQELETDRTIDMYNAETQRIRALSDNMVDDNKLQLDAINKILETSIKLDEHDIQREQMGHTEAGKAGELATKHNKMLSDALVKMHTANKSSQGAGQSSAARSTTAP